jgi:hypothetical protein
LLQAAGMRLGKVSVAGAEQTPPPMSASVSPAITNPNSAPVVPQSPIVPSASSLILSQNPSAGQRIVLGGVIDFEVSR